jgi:hypothetical protein
METLGNMKPPCPPAPAGAPPKPGKIDRTPPEQRRAGYVLMKYRPEEGTMRGYRLFRVSPLVLYLTEEEAAAIRYHFASEGEPFLMSAATPDGALQEAKP